MSNYTQEQETEIVRDAGILTAVIQWETDKLQALKTLEYDQKPPVLALPQKPKEPKKPAEPSKPEAGKKAGYAEKEEFNKARRGFRKYSNCVLAGIAIGLIFVVKTALSAVSPDNTDSVTAAFKFIMSLGAVIVLPILFVIIAAQVNKALWAKKEKEINAQYSGEAYKEYEEYQQRYTNELLPQYEKALEEYKTKTIPAYESSVSDEQAKYNEEVQRYNDSKSLWLSQKNRMMEWLSNDIDNNTVTLDSLYDETRIISKSYRDLWILKWLYDDMSSSDHDIRYATELLDRDRQRIETRQAGQNIKAAISNMTEIMTAEMESIYSAINEGNQQLYNLGESLMHIEETADDSYEMLRKTRRDNNFANLISIYQRYKYNKKD